MTSKSSRPRLEHLPVILLSSAISVLVLALWAAGTLAVDPPASGDWVVDDNTMLSDMDITVSGNVTVVSGGVLDLKHSTLSLDMPTSGAYHVEVKAGGTLVLDGVVLDSADGVGLYNMTITGSAMILRSEIRRLNGLADLETVAAPRGMVVQTSSFFMNDTVVEDCNGFAIVVMPGLAGNIEPVFTNSTIRNNGGGIVCVGILFSGNALIEDCAFYGNTIADVVAVASDPTITGCSFIGSVLTPTVIGILAFGTAEPVVDGCEFSRTFNAIVSIAAAPTIRDCDISWSMIGINVVGSAPVIEEVTISTTVAPMVLNATNAQVSGCDISSFMTPTYAISIDGGRPTINDTSISLSLFGGAVSIINGSRAVITGSDLTGSGAAPTVYVEDSQPSLEGCVIEGGSDGIELVDSPAYVRDCLIRSNYGWGIVSWFETFTNTRNDFGTGGSVNGDGRVIQYHSLTVHVELEGGTPAVDATVILDDALDDQVLEVATDGAGFAFSEVLVSYEITNGNRTIAYSPYLANATLGELLNITLIDISENPEVVLVLRPAPNLPPLVDIT